MDSTYEAIQAHVAELLNLVDKRLDKAVVLVTTSKAVLEQNKQTELPIGLISEYERAMQNVTSELDFLRSFSCTGPLSPQVKLLTNKAKNLLRMMIQHLEMDPDAPGLSEKVELKKAATLGRAKASQVQSVLKGFKVVDGPVAAGADLLLTLTIIGELGAPLIKILWEKVTGKNSK